MMKMAPGVRRIYRAALPEIPRQIKQQQANASKIGDVLVGENAFMAIVRTDDPEGLKREYAVKGIETETHFKNAIIWAEQFGYKRGNCPNAEKLVNKLLMIPTYTSK